MEVFGIQLKKKEEALVAMPVNKAVGTKKVHNVLGHVGMDMCHKTMSYWGWKASQLWNTFL